MVQQPLPTLLSAGQIQPALKIPTGGLMALLHLRVWLLWLKFPNRSSLHQQQLISKEVQCTAQQEVTRSKRGRCRKRRRLEGSGRETTEAA